MPTAPVKPGKKRLQFDFNEQMMESVNRCQEKLGAGSKAEVVRRAIRLLEMCLDQKLRVVGDDGVVRGIEVI